MPLPDLIARYREHGLLFGGGLLAGLLMFLIWLSLQPPRKVEAPAEAGTTTAGARGRGARLRRRFDLARRLQRQPDQEHQQSGQQAAAEKQSVFAVPGNQVGKRHCTRRWEPSP